MVCTKYHEIISKYVDEEANILESTALEEHVEKCRSCKDEMSDYIVLSGMIKKSFSHTEEIDLSGSIMRKIGIDNVQVEEKTEAPRKLFNLKSLSAAAALVLLTVSMVFGVMDKEEAVAADDVELYVMEHIETSNLIDNRVVAASYK